MRSLSAVSLHTIWGTLSRERMGEMEGVGRRREGGHPPPLLTSLSRAVWASMAMI